MRRLLALALCAISLAGCSNETPVSATWQITNVYVTPDTPSQVPEPAYLVFGDSSVTGSTGCAQIQGRVAFTPNAQEPTTAQFRDMNFEQATCEGSQRFFHDALVTMLQGDFEVKKTGDEMLLSRTGEFDRPGVRLVAAH